MHPVEGSGMESGKKEFLYVAAIFLQKLATAVADLLWLALLAGLIGEVMPENGSGGDPGKMAQYVLGLILLSAWKRMGYSFGRTLALKLQNRVRFRLNCRMVEKTAQIPYRLLEDHAFCELRQALKEDIDRNANGSLVWVIVQKSGNFMMYCVRVLGVSLLLAWASVPLGLLFLLLEICHCLMTALGTGQEASPARRSGLERGYMEELALGQEGAGERSLFAYAGFIAEKYAGEAEAGRREAFALSLEHRKTEWAAQTLTTIAHALAEIALAALMADGKISLGYFIALSIGISGLIQKNEEGDALYHMREGALFLKKWNRFLNLPETEGTGEEDDRKGEDDREKDGRKGEDDGKRDDRKNDKDEMDGRHGHGGSGMIQDGFETLEFRGVSFRYPRTGRYVLRDLNFKLTKGGYYAFVGANGSGKTTIVKLLSGLYDNYEGEIRLNGIELREISPRERRRMFAILFQDAAKYEDTIARNILPREMGTGDADVKGRIGRMAEELVREWEDGGRSRFPRGADTFLGSMEEDGVMLSAGEWQQLLILRELAQPAQIRVMDEPMAPLDIFRQGRIYERFTRDAGDHTTLLFSHHMAAVRKAKRIFVLEEGTIAEEGSHHRLMEEKGLYAKLYGTQRETRCAKEQRLGEGWEHSCEEAADGDRI